MDTASLSVPSISPASLRARQGRADAPLVLDVRREAKFADSPRLLAGALRCPPESVAQFAATEPPREVVVYCVYGHNVSADAVATLRAARWPAVALAGGIEGGEDGVDAPHAIAARNAAGGWVNGDLDPLADSVSRFTVFLGFLHMDWASVWAVAPIFWRDSIVSTTI